MLGLIAILKVQDGKQAEFEATIRELVAATRTEPGNRLYNFTRKQGSTTEYVMMEQWADEAAINAHNNAPHFQAALPKLGPCLAGPPELIKLEILD